MQERGAPAEQWFEPATSLRVGTKPGGEERETFKNEMTYGEDLPILASKRNKMDKRDQITEQNVRQLPLESQSWHPHLYICNISAQMGYCTNTACLKVMYQTK